MKAMQFSEVGGPEVLELVELPDPEPGEGQVLVKVESAAINFSDVTRRRGGPFPQPTPLPFIPGGEVAGEVVALGAGVTGVAVGSKVFGTTSAGYAELVVMDAQSAVPRPESMSSDTAAGLTLVGLTATLLIESAAHVTAGETVFIPAASGGLANIAIQIAKLNGAFVIGGASTETKRDIARSYGADHVVDYSRPGWVEDVLALTGGRGVDVALEMTSPAHVAETLSILAPFGRLVVYGDAAGHDTIVDAQTINALLYDPAPGQSLIGFNVGAYFQYRMPDALAALQRIIGLAAAGKVKPPVIRAFPLADAAEAHRLLESGGAAGKLILHP